jgi:aconitase A
MDAVFTAKEKFREGCNTRDRIAIERTELGLRTERVLMVGLRGVGKTVLLARMRDDAEALGIQTLSVDAPAPILLLCIDPMMQVAHGANWVKLKREFGELRLMAMLPA